MLCAALLVTAQALVAPRAARPPRARPVRSFSTGDEAWDDMYRDLQTYRATWGTADAPLGDALGRWCAAQRRVREKGRLDEARAAKLDAIAFSWSSPSEPTEADLEARWELMRSALAAYVATHGDGQVPKKFRDDPALGGWVAAVRRRGRGAVETARADALDAAGFEWTSSRSCGSAFMVGFRAFRDWRDAHGDADPPEDLRRWSDAALEQARRGRLSRARLDYLGSIGLLPD